MAYKDDGLTKGRQLSGFGREFTIGQHSFPFPLLSAAIAPPALLPSWQSRERYALAGIAVPSSAPHYLIDFQTAGHFSWPRSPTDAHLIPGSRATADRSPAAVH